MSATDRPRKQAIETRCHLGESILYDTVGQKGWSVDVRTHRITEIINRVLNEDWEAPPSDEDSSVDGTDDSPSFWSNFWGWPARGPHRRSGHEGDDDDKKSPSQKKRNPNAVPKAETEEDCVDCFRW